MKATRVDQDGPNYRFEMNTAACAEVIDSVCADAMAAAIERVARRRAELTD